MSDEPYPTPKAVASAIKDAAKKAAKKDPSLGVNERIRLAYFDRFICRVFSEGDHSNWVLKGGTSMLARVGSARATKDIDLYRAETDLDQGLAELVRLAGVDLGDHFRFVFRSEDQTMAGDTQPYVDGLRVTFDAYLGTKLVGVIKVDLTATPVTHDAEMATPAHRLPMPRLQTFPVRLYPVTAQIADKVCATLTVHNGLESSREKDLVDLVILAMTQDIEAEELRSAIQSEARRRGLSLPGRFDLPTGWGGSYATMARDVPACAPFPTVREAATLMHKFLDPLFAAEPLGPALWRAADLQWIQP